MAISCHLFECHVLLIPNTKFQPDIPVSKFFGLPLYQEHRPSAGEVGLPPPLSCFPGRKYGTLASYTCSFTRYDSPDTDVVQVILKEVYLVNEQEYLAEVPYVLPGEHDTRGGNTISPIDGRCS